jgi:hypothetical protein
MDVRYESGAIACFRVAHQGFSPSSSRALVVSLVGGGKRGGGLMHIKVVCVAESLRELVCVAFVKGLVGE